MFKIGFFILAAASIACFFINNIYAMMIILVLASIGPAILEPNTEAYFFDIIKKQEKEKFYPAYNTMMNISAFLARILAALVILILPFKFIFVFFAIAMFIFSKIATKAKKIIEIKRKNKRR